MQDERVPRPLAHNIDLKNLPDFAATGQLLDHLGRPLRDLRISVTDRCNFRCNYCMPKEVFTKDYPYLPHSALLSFEEITRLAKVFLSHGVRKIRLTGGEPLLRKNLEVLITQLADLRTPEGHALDLTLTTNGSLLAKKAKALKAAGLHRVTVSLDGLDDAIFRSMNDVDFPVADVLAGIDAAREAGLGLDAKGQFSGIKINMVVKRGTNTDQILPMARRFQGTGMVLRFIEYMDVGASNGWRMDEVMPSSEVVALINKEMPLVQLAANNPGETAQRWGYADASGKYDPALGEIGVISSVTQAFCGDCNRARLSTEGKLYLCLFANQGYDLLPLLRGTDVTTDTTIANAIAQIWQQRTDRYSELRSSMPPDTQSSTNVPKRVEMSYIGG
ncbi:MAG: GTP 3',8-cyclase MoaA [Polaromonas sp.]|nr:GTP 3',8-cyclase MoaA [Polaromonas sp.]MBP6141612.1 GTP 3',8-cyclase MoaA [Polaromonas sp.]MBP6155738.1 GTP 3',8-cyclase MoaA [Polaromonas sp.]MBP7115223.1 GTP 3',8-cyclase MoaA [Polaromonas sp.]MBP7308548.1 GTP 3',8-cyclase MoaA [Polaromonas sp.]